jgi:predicted HNH restriction endonuclease
MKDGDKIFVKEGNRIVGRGTVTGQYNYDYTNSIQDPYGNYWHHQLPVKWEQDFEPVSILLGAEQLTVRPLNALETRMVDAAIKKQNREFRQMEALEGKRVKAEAIFRVRNMGIISAKKALSTGTCEICGFSFESRYGIKKDCLVAHHLSPIGSRRKAVLAKIDDILLVCPNCHAVAHTEAPPVAPPRLIKMLRD